MRDKSDACMHQLPSQHNANAFLRSATRDGHLIQNRDPRKFPVTGFDTRIENHHSYM